MNLLSFIKHFLLRRIESELCDHQGVRDFIRSGYRRPIEDNETSLSALRREIASIDYNAGVRVGEITRRYRPRIVFNMGYSPDEMILAAQIQGVAREMLSLELDFFGFVYHDRRVHHAIANRQLFLPNNRNHIAAAGISRIAQRIPAFWDRPVSDSARRIEVDARRTLAAFRPATGASQPAPSRFPPQGPA